MAEVLGKRVSEDLIFKAANGTRGAILVASTDDFDISFHKNASGSHFITDTITDLTNNAAWSISGVYGPPEDSDKILFLNKLKSIKNSVLPDWMILGDINLRMMGRLKT